MADRLKKIELTAFQRFFRTEAVGGLILLLFGLAALALANSPLAEAYEHLWDTSLTVGIVDHSLSLTLHQWINDGLMAVFFLLVGLEIKRELLAGELSSSKQAALPIACAIGGMIVAPLGAAKTGILAGSLLAGVVATVILKTIGRAKRMRCNANGER